MLNELNCKREIPHNYPQDLLPRAVKKVAQVSAPGGDLHDMNRGGSGKKVYL